MRTLKVTSKVLLAGLLLSSGSVFGATYKLDPSHLDVGFTVTHLMISKVKGRFVKADGSFDFDEKKNELKGIDVKIDVASVNTDDKKRDEHLTSDDFFSAKKFPEMTFKGEKVEMKDGKPAKITGNLTIKGVTKPVTLDVEYRGTATDPWGNERVGFSATGKINRQDFGIKWNKSLDKGGVAVSDEVAINIDGEAIKEKAPAAKK